MHAHIRAQVPQNDRDIPDSLLFEFEHEPAEEFAVKFMSIAHKARAFSELSYRLQPSYAMSAGISLGSSALCSTD